MSEQIRCGSNSFVYAPGIFRWARKGLFPHDPDRAREILSAGWKLPEEAVDKALAGDYTVEDDVVIIEVAA